MPYSTPQCRFIGAALTCVLAANWHLVPTSCVVCAFVEGFKVLLALVENHKTQWYLDFGLHLDFALHMPCWQRTRSRIKCYAAQAASEIGRVPGVGV
jgi:hypothetical protein